MTVYEIGRKEFNPQAKRNAHTLVIWLAAATWVFFAASLCLAQNDLVRLVPPDAPVIAGLHRMGPDQNRDALWLATRNNTDDLSRLVALTDHDPERRIDQAVVAAWGSGNGSLTSHLVIAQGRFNLAAMAMIARPQKLLYNGVPVLAIEGKGASQPSSRWLAVLERNLAVFGTPDAVTVALDRFRSGASVDPMVLDRLRLAHARDAAWSSILLGPRSDGQRAALGEGDRFAACLAGAHAIGLGIRPAKRVSIELGIDVRDGVAPGSIECLSQALFSQFTPKMSVALSTGRQPGVSVTMERREYEAWLESFRKLRIPQVLEAMISGRDAGTGMAAEGAENVR